MGGKLKGAKQAKKKVWGIMGAEQRARKIALMAAGAPIKAAAERESPVDTGILKRGFAIRTNVKNASVSVGIKRKFSRVVRDGKRRVRKRPGRYLHLAEKKHGFMERAGESSQNEALERYAEKLKQELDRHAAGG